MKTIQQIKKPLSISVRVFSVFLEKPYPIPLHIPITIAHIWEYPLPHGKCGQPRSQGLSSYRLAVRRETLGTRLKCGKVRDLEYRVLLFG